MHILHESYEFDHIKQHAYDVFLEIHVYAHLMKHHNKQKKNLNSEYSCLGILKNPTLLFHLSNPLFVLIGTRIVSTRTSVLRTFAGKRSSTRSPLTTRVWTKIRSSSRSSSSLSSSLAS